MLGFWLQPVAECRAVACFLLQPTNHVLVIDPPLTPSMQLCSSNVEVAAKLCTS